MCSSDLGSDVCSSDLEEDSFPTRRSSDLLCLLMAAELTIKIDVPGHVAVMQAINEAIERREKGHGKSQP